jgi:hypothetical protein
MRSLYIVELHVAVNDIKPPSVFIETQQCFSIALLSSYGIFRAAVNNTNVLRSSCKVPEVVVRF